MAASSTVICLHTTKQKSKGAKEQRNGLALVDNIRNAARCGIQVRNLEIVSSSSLTLNRPS